MAVIIGNITKILFEANLNNQQIQIDFLKGRQSLLLPLLINHISILTIMIPRYFINFALMLLFKFYNCFKLWNSVSFDHIRG
jgi:hypothetical protein